MWVSGHVWAVGMCGRVGMCEHASVRARACVHTRACVCRGGRPGPAGVLGSEMTGPCPGPCSALSEPSGHLSVTQKCPGCPRPASRAEGPAEAPGWQALSVHCSVAVSYAMQVSDVAVGSCPWRQQQDGRTPALGSLRALGAAAGEMCLPPAHGAETGGQEPQVSTQPPCVPTRGDGKGRRLAGPAGSCQPPGARRMVTQAGAGLRGPPPRSPPGGCLGLKAFAHPQQGTLRVRLEEAGGGGTSGPPPGQASCPWADSNRDGPAGWAEPVADTGHLPSGRCVVAQTQGPVAEPPRGGGDCWVPSSQPPTSATPPETWSRFLEETQSQTWQADRWLRVW